MVGCMTLKEKKSKPYKNALNEQKLFFMVDCSLSRVDSYLIWE